MSSTTQAATAGSPDLAWMGPVLQRLLLLGLVVGIWWIGSRGTPAYILPGPEMVFRAIGDLVATPSFFRDLGASLGRVAAGLDIAPARGPPRGNAFVETPARRSLLQQ